MTYFITNRKGKTIIDNIQNKETAINQAKELYLNDNGVGVGRYCRNRKYVLLPLHFFI